MKPHNKQMHCQISPRRAFNPCAYTMKISSRYHWLLIYDVKRNTKTDGMGPFKLEIYKMQYSITLFYLVKICVFSSFLTEDGFSSDSNLVNKYTSFRLPSYKPSYNPKILVHFPKIKKFCCKSQHHSSMTIFINWVYCSSSDQS